MGKNTERPGCEGNEKGHHASNKKNNPKARGSMIELPVRLSMKNGGSTADPSFKKHLKGSRSLGKN